MELKVISREIIQKAMEQDYLPHAEIFADEIAWMKDCVALLDEVDSLKEENNKLRAILAAGKGDCVYCGLPAADIAKCLHGFPGCARMDDMVNAVETAKDDKIRELLGIIAGLQDVAAGRVRPFKDIQDELEANDGRKPESAK
jgi:hypothetical protein